MESIQFNKHLVQLDIRSTDSGIANQFYVRLRLRDNRQRQHRRQSHRLHGRQAGDYDDFSESNVSGSAAGKASVSSSRAALASDKGAK